MCAIKHFILKPSRDEVKRHDLGIIFNIVKNLIKIPEKILYENCLIVKITFSMTVKAKWRPYNFSVIKSFLFLSRMYRMKNT